MFYFKRFISTGSETIGIKKYKNGNSQSVGVRGIGPPASRSRTVRSADELHPALKKQNLVFLL